MTENPKQSKARNPITTPKFSRFFRQKLQGKARPDMELFEQAVFKKKKSLDILLSFSLKLLMAQQVGLLFGTNSRYRKFLPPEQWDRGVMHKFDGKGMTGVILKYFGRFIVRAKGLSPVRLYHTTLSGERKENDGLISNVLRKHKNFYRQGIKILIIDKIPDYSSPHVPMYSFVSILSYNGDRFSAMPDLKINNRIVRQFNVKNIVSAYIPDYGAIVFNTIAESLLQKKEGRFVHEMELKKRLDSLILAIEMASLAYIGLARDQQAVQMIWRKEKSLRKAKVVLRKQVAELNTQREYLRAVGAVTEKQLDMEALNIPDGVYAFMDMVGSTTMRENMNPRDYFLVLNLCHQIMANNASIYFCRVDNFIGDAVFLQNASPFDDDKSHAPLSPKERLGLMIFSLASSMRDIHLLQEGQHQMDESGQVKQIVQKAGIPIRFRAGVHWGPALIGPLGSRKRKIVTAIGRTVNDASRLESSGVPQWIHVGEATMNMLQETHINKDTITLHNLIAKSGVFNNPDNFGNHDNTINTIKPDDLNSIPFFEGYTRFFKISGNTTQQRENVSYKEFFRKSSYLIRCIPDSGDL